MKTNISLMKKFLPYFVNIFEADKYDRILGRRKFPPGMHGNTRRSGKISEYGKQLVENKK